MGFIVNLVDMVLFFFFLVIAVAAPLLDCQNCLPITLFPDSLVDLKHCYTDHVFAGKNHFLVWLELIFQWPLALVNLYALSARKPWFTTTCFIYGISFSSSMVAALAEVLLGSGKASDERLMLYYPFIGLGVLAFLRGFVPHLGKATTIRKRPIVGRK